MRAALALLLMMGLARPTFAADPPPPDLAPDGTAHHHSPAWYECWSLIAFGGAATLVGAALTTRNNTDDQGDGLPGLSGAGTAGWALVAVGTVSWIAGAIWLHFVDRPPREPRKVGFDPRSGVFRF